jgi:autotransporter translocation and assembly factor TamB
MRLLRRILLGLAAFLLVLVVALWVVLHSTFFWRWAGGKLVNLAAGECRCAIQMGSIEGNAFDGIFFKNITMATSEGKVISAKSLEIKISFWSLFRLSPLITMLAVNEPHLNIHQEKDGEWNIIKILPPPPKQLPVNIIKVRFDHIQINHGDGKITVSGQTREFTNLEVDTDLDLEHPVTPDQAIKVGKALAGVTTPFGRVDLNSRFSYAKNYLDVEHLIVTSGDKKILFLAGTGNMAEGGEFQVKGNLNLPPRDIHKVWAKWPPTWDFATKFQVQGNRSQFNLTLNGKVQEVNFEVNGAVGSQEGTWHYDFQGKAAHLTPDLLAMFNRSLALKLDKVGPIDTKFHVKGTGLTFPPEKFSWNLETEPFEYGTARVDQLKVDLAGDKKNQQFLGSLKGPFGDLSLEASGTLFTGKQGKFCLNLDSFKPGPLGVKVPEGTVITATVGGNFSSPGLNALDRLQVDAELTANGQIGQHPLNDAYVKAVWSKNELKVSQATVQLGNVAAELHGALVGGNLNFSFQANSSREGNWPIPAKVGGQFSAQGTATGTLSDPQIALKASGHDLTYDKYAVKNFTLNAQIEGLPPSKGRINLQAKKVKTPTGVFSQATFKSDGSGKLWNFDLKANGKSPKIALRGTADFGRSSITLAQAHIDLYNIKVQNQGPVELVYSPGIEVKQATFTIDKGKASVQAKITQDQATGNLTLTNLPADLVLPKSIPLKGIISAKATLSGTGRQPVIQGNFLLQPEQTKQAKQSKQLEKLEQPEQQQQAKQNQGLGLQSVQATFTYQENRLSLNGSVKTKEKGVGLTLSGQMPVHISLVPFAFNWGQGGMQIVVKGEKLNLSLLPQLVKGVDDAKGPITLLVKVEGTMGNPQIAGKIGWGQGYIILRATGAKYQLLPGSINMTGNRITIPQLTLQSEGTATLTGDIDLAGYAPADVRIRLQFTNFKAIDKLKSEAFVNGAINLDGKYPNLAATGTLTIPKASFTLSFLNVGPTTVNKDVVLVREQAPEKKTSKGKKPSVAKGTNVWKNLRVDIHVRAPRDVRVDDPHAKIEVAVNIEVRKQPGQELVYSGDIHARHGQVFIAGRTFHVTRGVVTLPSQPGAEPVINGRIEYDTSSDVILFAEVTGSASNPKITLGGEPAISETDWMAYMLYGKPVAYLSREQQSTVSAAGAFGGLAARVILKDLLGMAPSFTKGLTVSYQQPSDPLYREDPYQVVINYRINRRISVQSQVGGRNTGGDVLFNFDF